MAFTICFNGEPYAGVVFHHVEVGIIPVLHVYLNQIHNPQQPHAITKRSYHYYEIFIVVQPVSELCNGIYLI